jgi:hypothetical protein
MLLDVRICPGGFHAPALARFPAGLRKELLVEPLNPAERLDLEIRYQSLVAQRSHEQVTFEELVHRAQAELDRRFPEQQSPKQ